VDGDIKRGRALYAPCVACHGPDALGNDATKAPALAGLNDWYLLGQLRHFKSGVRGASADDVTGAQMAPMMATLEDDQAMKDVVAYIQTLPFYR
jgi:cytochrome c oxidase subunit 2